MLTSQAPLLDAFVLGLSITEDPEERLRLEADIAEITADDDELGYVRLEPT
jgi:hypothetical protein